MKVRLKIDGSEIEAEAGTSVWDAADNAGITIPSMCYSSGMPHITSCMLCAVRDNASGRLFPSCSAVISEGMDVDTCSEEVRRHRKSALDLLLSEHVGDCEAPCRRGCPAHMDIPEMLRLIAGGELRRAVEVVKEDIPLPGVLGRICPAPCEKLCRRRDVDDPIGICALKRHVADVDAASEESFLPPCAEDTGKSVAVIGAGPAGLSAAYFLRRDGHMVTLYEKCDVVGGSLKESWAEEHDLSDVIENEADVIRRMGVEIRLGAKGSAEELRSSHDAVVIASGKGDPAIEVDRSTFATGDKGVFAIGSAVRQLTMVVRASAQARSAAASATQFLNGQRVTGWQQSFDCRLPGRPSGDDLTELMKGIPDTAHVPLDEGDSIDPSAAAGESTRCMGCDCLKKKSCKLRDYSEEYEAGPGNYPSVGAAIAKDTSHPAIVFEPGKCIKCGICVQVSADLEGSRGGVEFVNRGIETSVAAPLEDEIADALVGSGEECARRCPTGALSLKLPPS